MSDPILPGTTPVVPVAAVAVEPALVLPIRASGFARGMAVAKKVGPGTLVLIWLARIFLAVFINPRRAFNEYQIKRLLKFRKAFFLGAGKIMYWFPVIPFVLFADLLDRCGVSEGALGFAFIAVVISALIVVAFDVTRHSFGWVAFAVLFPLTIAIVLQLGFKIQVSSDIGRFLSAFHPDYPKGFANLLAFFLLIMQVADVVISSKKNSLSVDGNNYIPHIGFGIEGELNHGTHSLYVDEGADFMEAAPYIYECGTLSLRNRTDGTTFTVGGAHSTHDASASVFNLACAMKIKRAIDLANEAYDVEAVASPK